MSDLEKAFERWTRLAELQIQFIEKLGKYKLDVAKSEVVQAVAAGQWAVARMKALVAKDLEAALQRLQRSRNRTRRRIQKLERQAKDAAKIRDGEDLQPHQLTMMWAAYTVFERMTPFTVIEELINTALTPAAKRASSYVNKRDPERQCDEPPAEVDNVHSLLHWLKRQRYVPRTGTHAYRQVVRAFAMIASVAETETTKLNGLLAALEKGTYKTWSPLVIAALPDSVDVKRIVSAGVT